MIIIKEMLEQLQGDGFDGRIQEVYAPNQVELQNIKGRITNLITGYTENFDNDQVEIFSAPGRTEIGGNHTDHQQGCVIAGSISLDILACVSKNDSNIIRIQSQGFPLSEVDITIEPPQESEINTSESLIRGIAIAIKNRGYEISGFDAYMTSNVLKGSGLSSSAAYEVMIGVILNHLYCKDELDSVEIAKIGQYAENEYFKKPSGLMDQMASAVGGIIVINFKDPKSPIITKVDYDFTKKDHALCIVDTGGDHANLTDEYSAIPYDMKSVAQAMGGKVLSDVSYEDFMKNMKELREKTSDRAALRAMHYFEDSKRAELEAKLLQEDDFEGFLKVVKESGRSSYMYLQNVFCTRTPKQQPVCVVLAMCDHILKGRGAFRVHGGGFAGTIQAFVPLDMLEEFKASMENLLGEGKCHVLSIRPIGGTYLF